MPIDIQNLHIKSTVLQRSADGGVPTSAAESAPGTARAAARQHEQLLAEFKRMIRDALNLRQER